MIVTAAVESNQISIWVEAFLWITLQALTFESRSLGTPLLLLVSVLEFAQSHQFFSETFPFLNLVEQAYSTLERTILLKMILSKNAMCY